MSILKFFEAKPQKKIRKAGTYFLPYIYSLEENNYSLVLIAFLGHTGMHTPQPMHLSWSMLCF